MGFKAVIPLTANKMKRSGDFRVETYKTWYKKAEDYKRKAYLTKMHFKEVAKGDIILVANYEKKGKKGYIGGATLNEMAIAFYLKKPIYILNPIDQSSSFKEEILGMFPAIIKGDLSKIK